MEKPMKEKMNLYLKNLTHSKTEEEFKKNLANDTFFQSEEYSGIYMVHTGGDKTSIAINGEFETMLKMIAAGLTRITELAINAGYAPEDIYRMAQQVMAEGGTEAAKNLKGVQQS